MYDATNESPEGGKNYPKIGVTPEFMDSYTRLKEFLVKKYGTDEGNARLKALARYFQEIMNDHDYVDRMADTFKKLG